jgi:hypothetical protein
MNETDNQAAPPSTERNPYTLWFVVLAFIAPVALAYYVFFFVHISNFTNHGQLLKPMIQLSSLKLKDESNTTVTPETLDRKWCFITFTSATCDDSCKKRLVEARQVHASLGKEASRVVQVLVELSAPDNSFAAFIKKELPNAVIVKGDAKNIAPYLPKGASLGSNDIYIQDPIGNIMMRFIPDKSMKDIRSDINTLLKVSQIG